MAYTGLPSKSITYGYWPDGSRQSMGTPAGAFSYAYDADGRMTGLTNPFGEASSWQYLDNGWLWTQTLGNGAVTTYTYNALGQTTDLVNRTSGGALLSEFAVPNQGGYDGAGNRTALAANLPAAPAGYSGTTAYAYDAKDQLTQEQSTRLSGYTDGFGYDAAGNPTTMRGQGHSFNADNQDTANTYDGDGNPSRSAADPENRLTQGVTALAPRYRYNGDGLQAYRVDQGPLRSTVPTWFLFDGSDVVCELDASGGVKAVNTFGAGGLLSRRAGSGSAFYTFDMQGNTAQRLDSSGGVLSSDLYDAFGSRASTSNAADPFGYGAQWGYRTDAVTGLVLCTHRYYDPQNGRWLTRDPMGYAGGVNLYGYVGNNPVNKADPEGTMVLAAPVVAGAGAVAAAAAVLFALWCLSHPRDCSRIFPPPSILAPPIRFPSPIFPRPSPSPPPPMPTTRPVNDPRELGLPTEGDFPYRAPRKWRAGRGIETDADGNPVDRNGRAWEKGPNHHFPDEGCEWDVQMPGGGHVNVGGDSGTPKWPKKGNK